MFILAGLLIAMVLCFASFGFFLGEALSDLVGTEPFSFLTSVATVFIWFGLTAQIIYWIVTGFHLS